MSIILDRIEHIPGRTNQLLRFNDAMTGKFVIGCNAACFDGASWDWVHEFRDRAKQGKITPGFIMDEINRFNV